MGAPVNPLALASPQTFFRTVRNSFRLWGRTNPRRAATPVHSQGPRNKRPSRTNHDADSLIGGVAVGRGGPWIPRWDRHFPGTGGPQVAHEGAADTSPARNQAGEPAPQPTARFILLACHIPPERRSRRPSLVKAAVTLGRAAQTTPRFHGLAEKIKTTADSADEPFLCVQAQLQVAHHLVNTLDGATTHAPALGQDQEVIHVPDIADPSVAHQLLHDLVERRQHHGSQQGRETAPGGHVDPGPLPIGSCRYACTTAMLCGEDPRAGRISSNLAWTMLS